MGWWNLINTKGRISNARSWTKYKSQKVQQQPLYYVHINILSINKRDFRDKYSYFRLTSTWWLLHKQVHEVIDTYNKHLVHFIKQQFVFFSFLLNMSSFSASKTSYLLRFKLSFCKDTNTSIFITLDGDAILSTIILKIVKPIYGTFKRMRGKAML